MDKGQSNFNCSNEAIIYNKFTFLCTPKTVNILIIVNP